jgi:hypothetical protein
MSYSTASFAVPALDYTSTDPQIAVGTVVKGTENSEFVYVQAAAALTQFDAVAVTAAGSADQLDATNAITGVDIGVAQVAFAINEYGFVQTRGAFSVNVLASAVTDVQIYATATAGSLDDAGTVALRGIQLTETDGGGGGDVTAHAQSGISVAAYA